MPVCGWRYVSVNWLAEGNTAVITGGASGVGLAAARHYLSQGMNVVAADKNSEAIAALEEEFAGVDRFAAQSCDVADFADVLKLAQFTKERFGVVHCLMNNAGTMMAPSLPWENIEQWKQLIEINQWGIIHGCHAFLPDMIASGQSGCVINTGSKQGITNPPGGYAYNMSKAGVKAFTESLSHALREQGTTITAHLLVPGFTYTGLIARFVKEQPPGAWTSEQVVEYMLDSLTAGDFYILCPDNDTPRELDERRIQWQADDLIHNRPALSRWHPDWQDAYKSFEQQEK